MNRLTRRDVLKTFAAGGAALVVGSGCCRGGSRVSAGMPDPRDDNEGFTFLHMTDMHVRRKRKGDEGYRACIAQVNALDPLPELSLMGGDLAFDGNYTAKDEFIDQINVYKEISDGLKMPYYNSIGNHDALGWNSRRKVAVDDPDIGKKCIMDRLGMEKSYYSFDHKGWHFAVLDCIYGIETEDGPSYEARIGEEQLHWLAHDLGRANKPSIVMTHIAGISADDILHGNPKGNVIHSGIMVLDTQDLRHVLQRHKVKALLQGHRHMNENYLYRGVWYLSSDAVSACWWSGTWRGHDYGYTALQAMPDGRLAWEHRKFIWETYLEPEDTLERQRTKERQEFEAEQARLAREERGEA